MRLSLPTRPLLIASAIGLALVTSYTNCTKSDLVAPAVTESSSLGDPLGCKAVLTRAALTMQKASDTHKLTEDLFASILASGTELAVVIDSTCHNAGRGNSLLSQKIKASGFVTSSVITAAAKVVLDTTIAGSSLEAIAQSDECVLRVDQNAKLEFFAMPNDPRYADQYYLRTIKHDQIVSNLFNSVNGITRPVRIAIIDSGVDANHPDLSALFTRDLQGNLIALNGMTGSRDVLDTGFHGTHVTGLAAGIANNAIGISGVLGQNATVMPIKSSTDGTSIDMAAVINGIRWATDNGANVINMSLGGPLDRPALKEAMKYAASHGVVVVSAAGNDGQVLSSSFMKYPGGYSSDIEGAITVGSIDAHTLALSSFSNRSPTFVEILAPGSDGSTGILSTVPANKSPSGYASYLSVTGGVAPINGTSMSSPIVSGAAAMAIALAKSRGYQAHPDQIEKLLRRSAVSNGALLSYADRGAVLDVQALVNLIDADTHVTLGSGTPNNGGYGTIAIARHPAGASVMAGAPLALSVDTTAASAILINYQWYKNGVRLTGETKRTLEIPIASSANAGRYFVELSAGSTVVRSQEALVQVQGSDSCL